MLLSLPTWLIHILTVTEWLAAMLLFHRYGGLLGRGDLQRFAWAMTPHLLGGSAILLFHLSGDRVAWLLDGARLLTFAGSLLLLAATLALLPASRPPPARRWGPSLALLILAAGLLFALVQLPGRGGAVASLLPATNLAYLAFLVLLLVVARRDPLLFSPLSIFGFWFLLVFVAVTITTTHIATVHLGLPSLAHADLLHGASEALLSFGNLMIAVGVYVRLRALSAGRFVTIQE